MCPIDGSAMVVTGIRLLLSPAATSTIPARPNLTATGEVTTSPRPRLTKQTFASGDESVLPAVAEAAEKRRRQESKRCAAAIRQRSAATSPPSRPNSACRSQSMGYRSLVSPSSVRSCWRSARGPSPNWHISIPPACQWRVCATRTGEADSPIRAGSLRGLAAAFWRRTTMASSSSAPLGQTLRRVAATLAEQIQAAVQRVARAPLLPERLGRTGAGPITLAPR
jgi:hypothetical protein